VNFDLQMDAPANGIGRVAHAAPQHIAVVLNQLSGGRTKCIIILVFGAGLAGRIVNFRQYAVPWYGDQAMKFLEGPNEANSPAHVKVGRDLTGA
jgi:hypothetical protein